MNTSIDIHARTGGQCHQCIEQSYELLSSDNPKQRLIVYKSLENIAEQYEIKVDETKNIKKLMKQFNNVQILNHLLSQKLEWWQWYYRNAYGSW